MVYSATTELYNNVFANQYNNLLRFARGDEDNVHDSYLKTLKRIEENGFTGHSETETKNKILIYSKTVIYNGFKSKHTAKKNNVELCYEAEEVLLADDNDKQSEKTYHDELEYFIMKLFDYLKKHHTEANQYVFRVYYLYDKNNRKITYNQLAEITGYSISKVCSIIQFMKADLRLNLINYINGINRKS